jgi:(2Fe-2S) ferredoxin
MSLLSNSVEKPFTALPLDAETRRSLLACSQRLSLSQTQRHVFLCTDPSAQKCCSQEISQESWHYLKKRMKALNLGEPSPHRGAVLRTKVGCLRVCQQGPILVIYPDGVWYGRAVPEVIERIIQEHLIGNRIVEEYAFLVHPLAISTSNY